MKRCPRPLPRGPSRGFPGLQFLRRPAPGSLGSQVAGRGAQSCRVLAAEQKRQGSTKECSAEGWGSRAQSGGETLPLAGPSPAFLDSKVSAAQRGWESPIRRRTPAIQPLSASLPERPHSAHSSASVPSPSSFLPEGSERARPCSPPARSLPTSTLGEAPIFTNLGWGGWVPPEQLSGGTQRERVRQRGDTQHAPSALKTGAQPTYMSARRGPDAGLVAGAGVAAAGADLGCQRPSWAGRGPARGGPRRAQPHLRAPPGARTGLGRLRGLAHRAASCRWSRP